MSATEQTHAVRKLKGLDAGCPGCPLPVTDAKGTVIGALRPVDAALADDDATVELLTKWRRQAMGFFLTQFEANAKRTLGWLKHTVLPDDTRILFVVDEEGSGPVGSIGLCNIAPTVAELDNVIGGVVHRRRGAMLFASIVLMRWAFDVLDVSNVLLRVFSDNSKAIRFYKDVGFEVVEVVKLIRHQDSGETRYKAVDGARPASGERGLTRMSLSRQRFRARWSIPGFADAREAVVVSDPDLVKEIARNPETGRIGVEFVVKTTPYRYSHNFTWLGRPFIQCPQDIVALQEIIWSTEPDLIIETGIAHGGGLVFYASVLELLAGDGGVVGVDVEIRPHNREAVEAHPMFKRITMIEGWSTDARVVAQVREKAKGRESVMVLLDSKRTHDHVLKELQLYSPLVTRGSYLVVFDTVIEDMPEDSFPDRPWGKGNNPKTAVWEFLKTTDRFVIDKDIQNKLLITCAPDGYLRCVKD